MSTILARLRSIGAIGTWANLRDPTKRLTTLYIFALSLVGLLTILGQFAVQDALARLQGDSRLVNIAGRQRMISQRLPKSVLALMDTNGQNERNRILDDIKVYLDLWQENHRIIRNRTGPSGAYRLPSKNNSEVTEKLFSEIDYDFSASVEIIQKFTDQTEAQLRLRGPQNREDQLSLMAHTDSFLKGMERIVGQYEIESRERVNRLQAVERFLLIATLSVLLAEGLFIFSPAVSSLRRTFGRLEQTTNELAVAKNQAEFANRAKTQFLARVSHELRTPLHAISGLIQLLGRKQRSSKDKRQFALMGHATGSLKYLVDDLLDVAAIEIGDGLNIQSSEVPLEELLRYSIIAIQSIAADKGLAVHLELDGNLPPMVYVDGHRLEQVLTNLLQNAIRYTPSGSIRLTACCREQKLTQLGEKQLIQVDQYLNTILSIRVIDTGVGIAEEDHQRIFHSFVRLDEGTASNDQFGRGLGLGLSIASALIGKMGGTLNIESKQGQGSTFVVEIPCRVSSKDVFAKNENASLKKFDSIVEQKLIRNRQISRAKPERSISTRAKRRRVLIIDDTKTNRLLLTDYFRVLGWSVKSVERLDLARDILKRIKPDLIVTDKHLADGDGVSFAKELSDSGLSQTTTPIIILTADVHFRLDQLSEVEKNWICDVLHKPLTIEDLKSALGKRWKIPKSDNESTRPTASTEDDSFASLTSRLREEFLNQLPIDLEAYMKAIAQNDLKLSGLIAHRIRGSAATAGLDSIATYFQRLEEEVSKP